MTLFDWLSTNDGHTFLLAVVGLLQAGSYYLWWLSHQDRQRLRGISEDIRQQVDGHLAMHTLLQDGGGQMKTPPDADTSGGGSSKGGSPA
jgi:hypothetical protein